MVNIHNKDRVIALAGIMQTSVLVNSLARGRWIDDDAFVTSINSLFVTHPDNILTIYNNDIRHLQVGLKRLIAFFPKPDKQTDMDVARYFFGCILLTKKLSADNKRMENIAAAINALRFQANATIDDTLLNQLANIYTENVSNLKHQIQIVGSQTILKQPNELHRLRALLLAGIRSTILWRQLGGKMWHFWWKREKVAEIAHELIKDMTI